MKNSKFKGIAIILIALVICVVIMSVFVFGKPLKFMQKTYKPTIYKDNFSKLDKDFWYAGEWKTNEPAAEKLVFTSEAISLAVTEEDKGPYLLSKPIALNGHDLIKIKRRVMVHPGSDFFAGGLVIFQTSSSDMAISEDEDKPYGSAVALVEYAYDYGVNTERPGEENIRLLGPNWQEEENYALLPPIFDQWFVEELIIDNANKIICYKVNGREVEISTFGISEPYFRIMMHSYGAFTGHNVTIDDMEIVLTNTEMETMETTEE